MHEKWLSTIQAFMVFKIDCFFKKKRRVSIQFSKKYFSFIFKFGTFEQKWQVRLMMQMVQFSQKRNAVN